MSISVCAIRERRDVFRSVEVNEDAMPLRVNSRRAGVSNPRPAASSYSLPMVVCRLTGSSRTERHGYAGIDEKFLSGGPPVTETAPRTTFEVRQHSTVNALPSPNWSNSAVSKAAWDGVSPSG